MFFVCFRAIFFLLSIIIFLCFNKRKRKDYYQFFSQVLVQDQFSNDPRKKKKNLESNTKVKYYMNEL